MEETNRTFAGDEGEETMVTPRFDDEETVLARPVVPFEEVGDAPAASASPTATAAPPPLYTRLRAAPRRSRVAVLVLVSVLAGSVLGVGGLYFYQKHRNADATPAAEHQQADANAPAAQPTAEAVSQSRETSAPVPKPSAPVASESDVRADDEADSAKDKGSEKDKASQKNDDIPVAARRNISESRDPVVAPKHGKKGEHDEDSQREERRARRDNDDDQPVRADDSGDDRREARRVGVITYRPRRVRTRRDDYGTPDRLRRIFEGQP
jgi:hypothetical protein